MPILLALAPTASAERWQWVSPAPSVDYQAILWDGRQLVAAGGGVVATSPDGQSWTVRYDSTSEALGARALKGLATNGQTYVAVGSGCIWSPDAMRWTRCECEARLPFEAVIWHRDRFVAVGSSQLAVSPDGRTWSVSEPFGTGSFSGMATNGDTLVAVGWTSQATAAVQTSTDGVTWQPGTIEADQPLSSVVWAGGRFVAVGGGGLVTESATGLEWAVSRRVDNLDMARVVWTGSGFVASGTVWEQGQSTIRIAASSDGEHWEVRDPAPLAPLWSTGALAWDGRRLHLAGVLTSTDGTRWIDHRFNIRDAVSAGDLLVAVGDAGTVLTSGDGGAWTRHEAGIGANLVAVAWTGSEFVAAASDHTTLASRDGRRWGVPCSTGLEADIVNLTWTGSRLVALLANGTLAASENGCAFSWRPAPGGPVAAVAANGHELVAVGAGGLVLRSTDGLSWTRQDAAVSTDLTSVAWTGSRFVAVGAGPAVISSADGLSWHRHLPPRADTLGSFPPCEALSKLDRAVALADTLLVSGSRPCHGPFSYPETLVFASLDLDRWAPYPEATARMFWSDSTLATTAEHVLVLNGSAIWRAARIPERLILPTAANLPGAGGTYWRTDLEVSSRGATPARYMVELLPRTGSPPPPVRFTLQPGASRSHLDILANDLSFTGAGALRITALAGQIEVTGRTYTHSGSGTFGQGLPAISERTAARAGVPVTLVGLSRSSERTRGFRTNLGLVNVGEVDVEILVELWSAQGAKIGEILRRVPAGRSEQIDDVFRAAGLDAVENARAVLSTATPNGAFLAFASVIDNRTGDPSLVVGR